MAADSIELSIYTFALKEKNVKKGEYFNLNEFYRKNFIFSTDKNPLFVEQDELYNRFKIEIIKDFKNKFRLNKEGTKGISSDDIKSYSNSNVIDGIIIGGNRGLNHKIYKINDNSNSTGELSNDEIMALPHYFKIWTPPNSQVGILMIQNYSNSGITTLLIDFLKDFYTRYNTSFSETRFVPNEIKESFINRSVVKKVSFIKSKLGKEARQAFNYAFTDEEGIKIKIEISGFSKETPVKNFIDDFYKNEKLIGIDLEDLEITNDEDVKTTLYYEDDKGKKAHAKIESKFKITPTISLPEELLINGNIDYEKVKEFSDSILEKVKVEIGYKTE